MGKRVQTRKRMILRTAMTNNPHKRKRARKRQPKLIKIYSKPKQILPKIKKCPLSLLMILTLTMILMMSLKMTVMMGQCK